MPQLLQSDATSAASGAFSDGDVSAQTCIPCETAHGLTKKIASSRIKSATPRLPRQQRGPQLVERAARRAKHTVPSTITPQMRDRILSELAGGRSVVQIAKEYAVREVTVIELWIRHDQRTAFRRNAA